MATDKTEVPVGSVITIGLLSIGFLAAVHQGIWGYYYSMYGEEQQRKVLSVQSGILDREHTEETQRLASIDRAMQQVGSSVGTPQRPSSIMPRPSTDLQPLQGWQLRPRVVPNPPPAQGDIPAGADTTAPAGVQAPAPAQANAPVANAAASAAGVAPTAPGPEAHAAPTTANGHH